MDEPKRQSKVLSVAEGLGCDRPGAVQRTFSVVLDRPIEGDDLTIVAEASWDGGNPLCGVNDDAGGKKAKRKATGGKKAKRKAKRIVEAEGPVAIPKPGEPHPLDASLVAKEPMIFSVGLRANGRVLIARRSNFYNVRVGYGPRPQQTDSEDAPAPCGEGE